MHERVHDTGSYTSKAKKVYTAVSVYNDLPEYRLYGVTDCLEFSSGLYRLVEYKPAKPKSCEYNHDDLMQVFAQKICTDYALKCDCEGYIYYSDVKKHIKLPLHEGYSEYDLELKELFLGLEDLLLLDGFAFSFSVFENLLFLALQYEISDQDAAQNAESCRDKCC